MKTSKRAGVNVDHSGTAGNWQTNTSVLISHDGRVAVFGSNSTNLLGAALKGVGVKLRAYQKLLP